jgi:hypothetical protein
MDNIKLTNKQLEYVQDGLIGILQEEAYRQVQYPEIYNESKVKEVRETLEIVNNIILGIE